MSELKIDFKTLFRLSVLIMIMILFLLIPLMEVNLLRQIVFKWLVIYLFSILGILVVNNKMIHSITIDLVILFLSPVVWLFYGAAAIWYIRLFSMDWYWFVVYPGFAVGLAVFLYIINKDKIVGIVQKPIFKILYVFPVVLGLIRCFLWAGDIVSWNQIILLGIMNFTGAIQMVVIGGSTVIGIKENIMSKALVIES
jgi:hypothetical protein